MPERDDDDHDDPTYGLPPMEDGLAPEEVLARLKKALQVVEVNAVSAFDQLMAQLRDVLPLMNRSVEGSGLPAGQRHKLIVLLAGSLQSAITGMRQEGVELGQPDAYLRVRKLLGKLDRHLLTERVKSRAVEIAVDLPGEWEDYDDYVDRSYPEALHRYGDTPTDSQLQDWLLDSPPGKAARRAP